MFRLKHRSSRAAFKCVFAFVGIAFFTAQLSYKFYSCSSQVIFVRAETSLKVRLHTGDGWILSLDKRYKAQKPVVLVPLPLRKGPGSVTLLSLRFPLVTKTVTERRAFVIALRGPPGTV